MRFFENETTELKSIYTDDIKKTAVAFANTDGGRIYIGVGDDGEVIGIADCDDLILRIVNSCRNAIKPDITMFIKAGKETIDGKDIVAVDVSKGTALPYYIGERGLKPGGVYVRVGSSTVAATDVHIRNMIKEADGDGYCNVRCLETDLTFFAAESEFAKEGLKFGDAQKVSLGIMNADKQYTNLALLLSEQCKHTIKLAVFEGTTKTVFRDRKEFEGSLFKQLDDVYSYLMILNKVHAVINGIKRTDNYDYPPVALREALLNALIHRDYSFSGSIFVNIYDDRLEILSLGGLVKHLDIEAIKQGFSQSRNERLANIFYKLGKVEAYGTGIPRIMDLYGEYAKNPEFAITPSSFAIIFPNANYGDNGRKVGSNKKVSSEDGERVLDFVRRRGTAVRQDIIDALGFKSTHAYNILSALETQGKIKVTRKGKAKEYSLPS
ncbi:MAG: putative DNA binding domain-containing protein [Clostridiales bacterium]|jgi:ATP-dependent DNA helicase RecG|nr:putative DNA binding domain-containing protein [Clostridiales bacterium]